MAERRMAVIRVLLCLCLCVTLGLGQAVSAADAASTGPSGKECSLTLFYGHEETGFSGVTVKLYKFADMHDNYRYSLTEPYAKTRLRLNDIQASSEWNTVRSTLESFILAENIGADFTAATDADGLVNFSNLTPGLYLAEGVSVIQGGKTYVFETALIALPGKDSHGQWQYQVAAAPKYQVIVGPGPENPEPDDPPPIYPTEIKEYKVLKLWKGDSGSSGRPDSIEADIYKDSRLYQTIVLSEKNNWSYSWAAKADGSRWTVAERNIPAGYAASVEERGTTLVLINTLLPEEPLPEEPAPEDPETEDPPKENPSEEKPDKPSGDKPKEDPAKPSSGSSTPKTGDTSPILLYTMLIFISGSLLFILGFAGKRKSYEKEK